MAIGTTLGILLRRLTENEERRFWTGQACAIAATVVAVYLAAYVGYDRALEYDQLVKDQSTHYLLSSMQAEVLDNLAAIDDIATRIETVSLPEQLGEEELEGYVWGLMAEQSETSRIPSAILTGTRRLYRDIRGFLDGLKTRQLAPLYVKNSLEETVKKYREETVPKTEAELARLKERLEDGGLPTE